MLTPDAKTKIIKIKNDNEFQPIILDIYDSSLLFHQLFKRAAGIIQEIVDRSIDYTKSKDNNLTLFNYPNNILAFCADRGQGKTTALISMANALSNINICSKPNQEKRKDFWNSARPFIGEKKYELFDLKFEVLEIMDPTMMNCKDSILRTVVSKMYKTVSSKWNNIRLNENRHVSERELFSAKEELVEKFLNCFKSIDNIYSDTRVSTLSDAYEDLSRISEIGDDITVKVTFAELVKEYLNFCRLIDEDNCNNILVIQIDDADLNTKYAYEIAEEIRKYFIVPNVIVMMALHVGTLSRTIQQHYIEQYKTLLDTKTNAITYDRCHSMMEKYIEKFIPVPHQLYVPNVNDIIKDYSDDISIHRFKKNKTTQESEKITFNNKLLRSDVDEIFLDYQEYLMMYLYQKTGIMLVKPEGYLHNFIPSNMRELTQFFSYFNIIDDIVPVNQENGFDGLSYVLSKCSKLSETTIMDLISIIDRNLYNIQYLFDYYYNNWCTMHLNDAEIQIIEKLNHAPLSSKNKTVVEQIKKYIERENTDESAIINNIRTKINIHEQDYLNYPHTPLSDVIFTIYNAKNKTRSPQLYYKLISAVEMYYTIYMRRLAFQGLKDWLKSAKYNDCIPEGSPFERICHFTEYKIFPDVYYSFSKVDFVNTGIFHIKDISDTHKLSLIRFLEQYCCPVDNKIKEYNISPNDIVLNCGDYYAYGSRIITSYLSLDDFYKTYYVDHPNLWKLIPNLLNIVCNVDTQNLIYHQYFKKEAYSADTTVDFITGVKNMVIGFDLVLNQNLLYNFSYSIYDCLQEHKLFLYIEDIPSNIMEWK